MRNCAVGWQGRFDASDPGHQSRSYVYGIEPHFQTPDPGQYAQLQTDEVRAQRCAIRWEGPIWISVVTLLGATFLLYLPKVIVVLWLASVLACDFVETRLFRLVEETTDQQRFYPTALFAVYLEEFCYSIPPSLIWQLEDAFSKAISIRVMSAVLMRLTTIHLIHPATGFAGTAAIATLISMPNSYYWLKHGDCSGFALTPVIAVISVGCVVAAITENHRQQQQTALGRMAVQRASEAKSHFLSQLSHELRTLLNAINSIGLAAHRAVPHPEAKEQHGILVQSTKGLRMFLTICWICLRSKRAGSACAQSWSIPAKELPRGGPAPIAGRSSGDRLGGRFRPNLPRSARLDLIVCDGAFPT